MDAQGQLPKESLPRRFTPISHLWLEFNSNLSFLLRGWNWGLHGSRDPFPLSRGHPASEAQRPRGEHEVRHLFPRSNSLRNLPQNENRNDEEPALPPARQESRNSWLGSDQGRAYWTQNDNGNDYWGSIRSSKRLVNNPRIPASVGRAKWTLGAEWKVKPSCFKSVKWTKWNVMIY